MQGRGATRRTGGRSARVRATVHEAVTELLAEQGTEAVTIAEVAVRSGVHPTSLYRRWGTVEALVLDVAVSRVSTQSPIPDTGSLRTDLVAYARQAAADVGRPDGLAFLRAVITTADGVADPSHLDGTAHGEDPRIPFLAARGAQIQTMLDRAVERGEPALNYTDVLDSILAPVYLRSLFGIGGVDDTYLARLVDHLLTPPAPPDPSSRATVARSHERATSRPASPAVPALPQGAGIGWRGAGLGGGAQPPLDRCADVQVDRCR